MRRLIFFRHDLHKLDTEDLVGLPVNVDRAVETVGVTRIF